MQDKRIGLLVNQCITEFLSINMMSIAT